MEDSSVKQIKRLIKERKFEMGLRICDENVEKTVEIILLSTFGIYLVRN